MEESTDKQKKASLLSQWKQKNKASSYKIEKRPLSSELLPSPGQKRLITLQLLEAENIFYNYAHIYEFPSTTDLTIVEANYKKLVLEQEILRSNYAVENGKFTVSIQSEVDTAFDRFGEVDDYDQAIEAYAKKPFDIQNDLLLKAGLLENGEKNLLILVMHHLIGDQQSIQIINSYLFSGISNEYPSLQNPEIQYFDYTHWQSQQKTSEASKSYWNKKLVHPRQLLSLPTIIQRPPITYYQGLTRTLNLSPAISSKILKNAEAHQTTIFNLILAGINILLYRNTGIKDQIIGFPRSTRDRTVLENLVGFFNDTTVLRSEINGETSLTDFVQLIKEEVESTLNHKNVPYEEIIEIVQPERIPGVNPIFQLMYIHGKKDISVKTLNGQDIHQYPYELGTSKFDISIFSMETKNDLELAIEYNSDLYEEVQIDGLLGQLVTILSKLSHSSKYTVDSIPILSEDAKKNIRSISENADFTLPFDNVLEAIFAAASKNPYKIAVTDNNGSITYAELLQSAYELSSILKSKGIEEGDVVGICIDRKISAITAMLGSIISGACYVPIDPDYPIDRIKHMLSDSGAKCLLYNENSSLSEDLSVIVPSIIITGTSKNTNRINLTQLPVNQKSDVYIIYTSGSTGKPKGVKINHENLAFSTFSRHAFYPKDPEAFLLLSSFSFDSSVVGIYWTLCSGGTLVIPPRRIEQDVSALGNWIKENEISHTLMLPSLYKVLLNNIEPTLLASLKIVMVAGEECTPDVIQTHFDKAQEIKLYNEYGPTEATVWCIATELLPQMKYRIPIGKPIPGAKSYVLDNQMEICPPNIIGELYIGGKGVTNGYFQRRDITQEKFINSPFSADEKLYKTGDLARFNSVGQIEFLGRKDAQVKLLGHRIELSEIEGVINAYHPKIEAAVIIVKEDSSYILAYIINASAEDISEISKLLNEKLPVYMLPRKIIPIEAFPKLPNGKIDRQKLTNLKATFELENENILLPSNELENILLEVWRNILEVDEFSTDANFFSLGGDSLKSIRLVSELKDKGIVLKPNQIFEHQTIQDLARSIVANSNGKSLAKQVEVEVVDKWTLSSLQQAFLFNDKKGNASQDQLLLEFDIRGELNLDLFKQALLQVSVRHESLRMFVFNNDERKNLLNIDPGLELPFQIMDFSALSLEQSDLKIQEIKNKLKSEKIDLFSRETSRFFLLKPSEGKHLLLWSCHHIFLDGWSCGIIIKDLIKIYEGLKNQKDPHLPSLYNYPTYLAWKAKRNKEEEIKYWQSELSGFKTPLLFSKIDKSANNDFHKINWALSSVNSQKIISYCEKNKLTQAVFYEYIFAIVLSRLFNEKDILIGSTVTGRFSDFPQIQFISGLFINVIPDRIKIDSDQPIASAFGAEQQKQGIKRLHEDVENEGLRQIIDWPGNVPLYDALYVFGNFLKESIKGGGLEISSFKGGFSSNFPLTFHVVPGEETTINIQYNRAHLKRELAQEIANQIKVALEVIVDLSPHSELSVIQNKIIFSKNLSPYTLEKNEAIASTKDEILTEDESKMKEAWQAVLSLKNISKEDNFFNLGGTSLTAIRLFAVLEKSFSKVLPPSTLFKYPTISALAIAFEINEELVSDIIIPIKIAGIKKPLFCLHGGGSQVFFYRTIGKYIDKEIPLYSIQPHSQPDKLPLSIEEMATSYISEIKKYFPEGPYRILGTCFSNAVALEMARQLEEEGEKPEQIIIVDSGPLHLFGDKVLGEKRTFTRFIDMVKRGDVANIKKKIVRRFKGNQESSVENLGIENESISETIEHLNQLYAQYDWTPIKSRIAFIRSKEFEQRKDKAYQMLQWKKLAKGGIEKVIVPGHHATLFDEPEATDLAKAISSILNK